MGERSQRLRGGAAESAARVRSDFAGRARRHAPEGRHRRRLRAPLYLRIGQRIAGAYEILQVLGEGGMGVVYLCRDATGELCSVKRVVLPESNPDEHLAWFLAEAQAVAALSHANVVRARDFGRLRDGTPYLVMDYVAGVLWHELGCEPEHFPLHWLLADQVLAALAHAHARGVVHGDLKPSNVLVELDETGALRARLFDFGLAKRKRSGLDPRLGQTSAPGEPPTSAGTPGYMAPEQLLGRGSEISSGTDLFALGCILYRLLSGRPPVLYEGSPHGLDLRSFRAPARPPAPPGAPVGLADFVLSLLVVEPWRRISSAAEARRAWQALRPAELPSPCTVRELTKRGRAVAGIEPTRPTGSRGPRTTARLGRSNEYLPGLLGVRPCPLVGRAELQQALAREVQRLGRSGAPEQRAIVLTGPAGVGKSRLAEWLCCEVEERGWAAALRGFRHAANVPRDPLALALAERLGLGRGALRLSPAEIRERCPRGDLGAVVDWVLGAPQGGRFAASEPLAPRLLRVFAALSQGRPLVVWLDDIAAITSETWATFAKARELAPELGLLLVLTARDEALGAPAIQRALRELERCCPVESLAVPPLDLPATTALLGAAHPLDPALAREVARESEGIPLAALSRLHALARRGRL